jgi:shikimate dehydrogenase
MNNPDRYAVFGNRVAHSKSPLLHRAFAEQTQQNIDYQAQLVEPDQFSAAADTFFAQGGKGLNVTVPFKQDAFAYAHQLTTRAQRAGAVNTLSLSAENIILGDNTDGIGLVIDITRHLHWPLADKHILLVGAGGAIRGVLEPIINAKPASLTLVNRTQAKAQILADIFADIFHIHVCTFDALSGRLFDIVINGTSASLANELPPLPTTIVNRESCCYDMMYGTQPTAFLRWAQQQGVVNISDGLGMLVCQGAESFLLWRGIKPETQIVINKMREILV